MKKPLKLTFIADTHHYSKTLGTSGKAYERRSGTDQKCLAETGDIIDSAFEKIGNSDTDALMIIGDLSDDGERVSHEEFIEKLNKLKEKKPIYVTVATHDWCCDQNPRRYDGDTVSNDVPTVDHTELREMYFEFGPKQAVDEFITHLGTSSYKIEFPDNVVLLALNDDQDGEGASGFTADHLDWVVKQIETEAANGKLVIGMEHHLLYPHISKLITGHGTCCGKHELYIEKFCEAGMRFMFVGHSHIQRIDKYTSNNGNEMYEINVGSLVGYSAPIVNMTVGKEEININTDHLESFKYNGEVYTVEYLKDHATNLFTRILHSSVNDTKDDFAKNLMEFGINRKTAEELQGAVKLASIFFDRATVTGLGKKINFVTFGTSFDNASLEKLRGVKVFDVVKNTMLSVLDGALNKYDETTAYYDVVTSFVHLPNKAVKKLHIKNKKINETLDLLDETIKEILTGGEIDNNNITVKR